MTAASVVAGQSLNRGLADLDELIDRQIAVPQLYGDAFGGGSSPVRRASRSG